MADKHHSAKYTRKKQRELEKKQKESFGMNLNRDETEFDRAVICFTDTTEAAIEETIEQNGRLKTTKVSLDKQSPKRNEYDTFIDNNNEYIKYAKRKDE